MTQRFLSSPRVCSDLDVRVQLLFWCRGLQIAEPLTREMIGRFTNDSRGSAGSRIATLSSLDADRLASSKSSHALYHVNMLGIMRAPSHTLSPRCRSQDPGLRNQSFTSPDWSAPPTEGFRGQTYCEETGLLRLSRGAGRRLHEVEKRGN